MTPRYFCHYCQVHIRIPSYLTLPTCPYCQTQFVEEETSHLSTASGDSDESLSWMEQHEDDDDDDEQDEWYDPWYLEFFSTRGYFDSLSDQTQHDSQGEGGSIDDSDHGLPQQIREQLREQDEEDLIPWFPAEDGDQDCDIGSFWVTNGSSEHDDDDDDDGNKSEADNSSNGSNVTREEQQWVTDEDDSGDESSSYRLLVPIRNYRDRNDSSNNSNNSTTRPSNRTPSPSPSSLSSSSSSLLLLSSSISNNHPHPSATSSYSRTPTDVDQQHSSIDNHPSSSGHRQNGFFRIERLLDMIYQGYTESDNEMDDTHYSYHQGFMDSLMDIFSDPMETPQTSTNSDIEQCIERLRKRTFGHGESGAIQECAICQEPFGAIVEIIQMPCQHQYHSPCLSQWLYVNATCPICRCPASSIIERTPPPPLPLSPIIMQRTNRQRRHSYPVIPEDEFIDHENENDVQEEDDDYDDDDDDQLSEYYEVTDPPPIWARSSSSSATVAAALQSSSSSSSRTHLVYHHLHDC